MNNTFGINDAPIGDLVLLHVMFHKHKLYKKKNVFIHWITNMFHVHLQVLNPYVSKFKQH